MRIMRVSPILFLFACAKSDMPDRKDAIINLSAARSVDFGPLAVSPDGKQIVFARAPFSGGGIDQGKTETLIMDLGTRETKSIGIQWLGEWFPSFTPNGHHIIYQSGSVRIEKFGLHSQEHTFLVEGSQPSISNDGQKIAFVRDTFHSTEYSRYNFKVGVGDIYICGINGSNIVRLTSNEVPDFVPRLAPSGDKVFFMSYRDDEVALYEVDIQTRGERKICRVESIDRKSGRFYTDYEPSYTFDVTPDGTKIAFSSRNTGLLFLLDLTTGKEMCLAQGWYPVFSKDGKRIAFIASYGWSPGPPLQLSLMTIGEISTLRSSFKMGNMPWFPEWLRLLAIQKSTTG